MDERWSSRLVESCCTSEDADIGFAAAKNQPSSGGWRGGPLIIEHAVWVPADNAVQINISLALRASRSVSERCLGDASVSLCHGAPPGLSHGRKDPTLRMQGREIVVREKKGFGD